MWLSLQIPPTVGPRYYHLEPAAITAEYDGLQVGLSLQMPLFLSHISPEKINIREELFTELITQPNSSSFKIQLLSYEILNLIPSNTSADSEGRLEIGYRAMETGGVMCPILWVSFQKAAGSKGR